MSNIKKLMMSAAGGGGLNVEDVFSTYLWNFSSAPFTVNNGIDLSGEGGLVWVKGRTSNYHWLHDSERTLSSALHTNTSDGPTTSTTSITSLNSDGFTVGGTHSGSVDHASWTFRKAPKFFDVVTWTGGGETSLTLDHDLGCAVGWLVVKRLDAAEQWYTWFRGTNNGYIMLDSPNPMSTYTGLWANTAPTSTQFTVADDFTRSGRDYVAYLFAHNNNDGEFGPDSDQDIIKCGSFNGPGATVTLGFEPQWILFKNTVTSSDWVLYDSMRGMAIYGTPEELYPNKSNAESSGGNFGHCSVSPTGFTVGSGYSGNYIYIAIARGPMAAPNSATDVFAIANGDGSSPGYESGFPVDLGIQKEISGNADWLMGTRLLQNREFATNVSNAASNNSFNKFDYQDHWYSGTRYTDYLSYMWRRAPGYFEILNYEGNGGIGQPSNSTQTITHNLGATPEMIWIKSWQGSYASSSSFMVYHSGMGSGKAMYLSGDFSEQTSAIWWNNTAPTDTTFTVGSAYQTNQNAADLMAYLFASLPGISKVGSYTGTGATLNIDCGFTSGARFVLIKRRDAASQWFVFDSTRGIVSGNDAEWYMDTFNSSSTSRDLIDPLSSGFSVTNDTQAGLNVSGGSYIFYAIA